MVSHIPWGRIRWVSVILGVAATLLFEALLTRFVVFSVNFPHLNDIFEGPGGLAMPGRNAALYETSS
jgi:hypothetical protein